MAVVVRPINEEFKLVLTEGEDKVEFFIRQLDYKTKSHITGLTTSVRQGQVSIDSTLTCFYNIKHGLKRVVGLEDEDGKPYQLEFEDKEKTVLTDKCVDELLATPISDNLQFAARELSRACYPDKILHPLTNLPMEGVEIIPAKQLKGTKKKS